MPELLSKTKGHVFYGSRCSTSSSSVDQMDAGRRDLYVQSIIQNNLEIVKIKIIFKKFINSTTTTTILPVNSTCISWF